MQEVTRRAQLVRKGNAVRTGAISCPDVARPAGACVAQNEDVELEEETHVEDVELEDVSVAEDVEVEDVVSAGSRDTSPGEAGVRASKRNTEGLCRRGVRGIKVPTEAKGFMYTSAQHLWQAPLVRDKSDGGRREVEVAFAEVPDSFLDL